MEFSNRVEEFIVLSYVDGQTNGQDVIVFELSKVKRDLNNSTFFHSLEAEDVCVLRANSELCNSFINKSHKKEIITLNTSNYDMRHQKLLDDKMQFFYYHKDLE